MDKKAYWCPMSNFRRNSDDIFCIGNDCMWWLPVPTEGANTGLCIVTAIALNALDKYESKLRIFNDQSAEEPFGDSVDG